MMPVILYKLEVISSVSVARSEDYWDLCPNQLIRVPRIRALRPWLICTMVVIPEDPHRQVIASRKMLCVTLAQCFAPTLLTQ